MKAAREMDSWAFLCWCGFSGIGRHPAARCNFGPAFRVLSLGDCVFPAATAGLCSESRIDIGKQRLGVGTRARLLELRSQFCHLHVNLGRLLNLSMPVSWAVQWGS